MLRYPNGRRRRAVPALVAALALLAPAACSDPAEEESSGLVTVKPDWIKGLEFRETGAEHDGIEVRSRFPLVPGADGFSTDVRTLMAEAETAFMTDRDDDEKALRQDAAFLAASDGVLGLRVTTEREGGAHAGGSATTRWYDATADEVMPWTALLGGKPAVEALRSEVARTMRDDLDLGKKQLPPEFRAAKEPTEAPDDTSPSPAEFDLKSARALAEEMEDSGLADIGFDDAGGLVVSVGSAAAGKALTRKAKQAQKAGAGDEGGERRRISADGSVQVPIGREASAPLLSKFGERAARAVTAKKKSFAAGAAPADDKGDKGEGGGKDGAKGKDADDTAAEPPVTIDCDRVPCVALTFDDGPGAETDALLDSLDEYSAKATFYLLGQAVKGNEKVIRRMADSGHEVANHSWKHDDLAAKSGGAVAADMKRTDAAIEKASGQPVRSMRPPYGSFDKGTKSNVGHPLVLWDVDTLDWQHRKTKKTTSIAAKKSKPGSVVLFHDIHRPTVKAFPETLRRLHNRGFHFVTVHELFGEGVLKDGTTHIRRDGGEDLAPPPKTGG